MCIKDVLVEYGSKKHRGLVTVPILDILPYLTFTSVMARASTIRQMNRIAPSLLLYRLKKSLL